MIKYTSYKNLRNLLRQLLSFKISYKIQLGNLRYLPPQSLACEVYRKKVWQLVKQPNWCTRQALFARAWKIPVAWFPSGVMMVSLGRPKNHARSETVRQFSPTSFARDSLVLRTLHDLPRNKQALSSLKYHIFTKILFTDLLQSLSSSWLKWLVLDQFTATSCSQRIRLEIPTSCSVLFSLFRLDPSFGPLLWYWSTSS